MRIAALLLAILAPQLAAAYPQLTRHGYFNCTACHVSPSGGGHLTEYGRGLSSELLSMWGTPGEEKPFYGLAPDSKHVTIAGYLRALQLYTDNERSRDAKAILMQTDLEAALHAGPFTTVVALGRREIPQKSGEDEAQLFSRTHYVSFASEGGVSVRAGRFMPYWGLNHPNHFLLVRRDLGFGNDTERYTAEGGYLGETFSALASHIFGAGGDSHARSEEEANSLSLNQAIGESHRVGAGWYRGSSKLGDRTVLNVNGLVAWSKKLFSQFEADYQKKGEPKASEGYVVSHQLGWELTQGLIPYAETQWEQLKLADPGTKITSWGFGANWYPRPHWELQVFGGQESRAAAPTTIFYGMLNLYL